MTYKVEVSYKDPAGRLYSEPHILDLSMYLGTGGVTRYGLHDIYKQVKLIADSMKKWSDAGGLKVLSRSDLKERREELEALWAERAERSQRAAEEAASDNSAAQEAVKPLRSKEEKLS